MENETQVNTSKKIIDIVSERIVGSSETIFNAVVEARTQIEVNKRVGLVESTLTKLQDAKKNISKLSKADINTGYDAEGVKLPDSFSKERIEELKKVKEQAEKVDKLLNTAMESQLKDDWNKLEEAVNKL